MRMPFRKPLIVISPKKLLRFKGACSNIEEFGEGTRF
jgi:2-oxoglutarate dehydrogenase complex dehydrogenase (E1) component-like enzyme